MAARTRPGAPCGVLSALLDFLLAPACLSCDGAIDPADQARLVCRRCRARLRDLPKPTCERCGAPILRTGRDSQYMCPQCDHWPSLVRFARSACLLHPPADTIVHQFKYGGWHALAGPMAERLARAELPAELRADVRVVIPVPTTVQRRRERGYNQSERLAAALAARLGWQLCDCLERTRAADTQVALQPLARAANVAGAFRLQRPVPELLDQHVVLVDDVLTTGATSVECAAVLVAAGVRCVSVLTFARALDARRLVGR